jgi:hypothetical protein
MRDFVIHPLALAFCRLLAQIGGGHSGCEQNHKDDQASGAESLFTMKCYGNATQAKIVRLFCVRSKELMIGVDHGR